MIYILSSYSEGIIIIAFIPSKMLQYSAIMCTVVHYRTVQCSIARSFESLAVLSSVVQCSE